MKDLIKDILTHLKENDEARERFDYNSDGFTFEFYTVLYKPATFYTKVFIIHALSSPNGKPICGFLEDDNKILYEAKLCENRRIRGNANFKINHASTLYNLLTKQIEQGKSFDKAYLIINKKYNEII